jgi:indole-3-acetate monooxygenase
MTDNQTDVQQGIETFDSVLDDIRRRRGEFARRRYVPRDVIQRFKALGLFRASAPAMFGGEPMPPADFLEKIEAISAVDGSCGWVASFGSSLTYLAALPVDTQAEIYKNGPDVAFAAGLWPLHPAAETASGRLLIGGRWKFASGSRTADILGVGIPGDAESRGKPRTVMLWPDQVEVVEEWNTIGMRGTGSFDLLVENVEVSKDWTFVRGGRPTIDEPLYQYPLIAYAAQVLAVVNLGIARAALDHAEAVGSGSTGVTGAPRLADRAYFRNEIARAEAELRSARAFFYDVTREAWDTILAGDPVSDPQNALLRLAATHAVKVGDEVVRAVYQLSGTGAIDDSHPVQVLLRDACVPPQHAFLTSAMYDAAGAVLMGLEPTVPGFR